MELTTVIPVYNGGPFIGPAVESALGQQDVEPDVVVVDDGSTDGTSEVLASFGDRIRVVRQENRGLAAARNAGIRVARGSCLAFLDADDLWEPSKSRKQLDHLAANPAYGLVFSNYHRIDGTGARFGVALDETAAHNTPTGRCLERLLMGNFVFMPTVMVRRSVLDTVGLFNEAFPPTADYDMWLRIAAVSEIGFLPEPLASYREWPGQMSADRDRMLDCEVQVLNDALKRHPDLARNLAGPIRRRFAGLYDEFGYRDLQRDRPGPAVRKFLRAARHDPLWGKPYTHVLAAGLLAAGLWRPRASG